jgi:hypothetical protein
MEDEWELLEKQLEAPAAASKPDGGDRKERKRSRSRERRRSRSKERRDRDKDRRRCAWCPPGLHGA